MDENKKLLIAEVKKMKGQLVLDCFKVVRLDGWAEDDDDYYWVLYDLKTGTYWSSFVGAIYPLKGVLPKKTYDYLTYIFKLNDNMIDEYKHKALLEKMKRSRRGITKAWTKKK